MANSLAIMNPDPEILQLVLQMLEHPGQGHRKDRKYFIAVCKSGTKGVRCSQFISVDFMNPQISFQGRPTLLKGAIEEFRQLRTA
jgi:hypothetical protein